MKKYIVLVLFYFSLNSFAQTVSFPNSNGSPNVKEMYTVKKEFKKNFFGDITCQVMDTTYANKVFSLKVVDENTLRGGEILQYLDLKKYLSNLIDDNEKYKTTASIKEISNIKNYYNRTNSEIDKFYSYWGKYERDEKNKNDSILQLKKEADDKQRQIIFHQDSIRIADSTKVADNYGIEFNDNYSQRTKDRTGNRTFKLSPQILSNIFTKNQTVEMLETTFPEWQMLENDLTYGVRQYGFNSLSYILKTEYNLNSHRIKEIVISHCTYMQIKSFKQLLIDYGFRINASASDLANTITVNYGNGEIREFYTKTKSSVCFVLTSNQIKVFLNK